MSTEQIIPWIAIFLSLLSLAASIYSIYRDQSKLFTYSEIIYDSSRNIENPSPILKIYAVNVGSRPITLTDFGFQLPRKSSHCSPLKPEPCQTDSEGNFISYPDNLAHNVGIKMEDGDIYEIRIRHDDHINLYSTHDGLEEAEEYFFKDVLGNKFFVKGSREGIKTLLNHKA